jgi:photosynthetic reaction center cytochrome c subunit
MKTSHKRLWISVFTLSVALLLAGSIVLSRAQQPADTAHAGQFQTAEQHFKNIQVLKNIPADQLIPSMQFIAASLGVECEFCHVEHANEKDDKKTKQTARKMITMMMALNQANFNGDVEVTCYTCHRGVAHPVSTPVLSADASRPPAHVHDEAGEAHPSLPSADEILDKYLTAVGGAAALDNIKTRVQKGTIDAFGKTYPIEIYSEAPEKRVSLTHPPTGTSVTAFNGEVGWLSMPGGFHAMTAAEGEAARIDAELRFAARLRELYKDFKVRPGEPVAGRPIYLVVAKAPGKPTLNLYFDQEKGLLLRLIRLAETPLGRNPTQIDYSDYRQVDGVKIPYRWALARPNGAFTIQVESVQQNVPVDEKLFVMPEPPPAAH